VAAGEEIEVLLLLDGAVLVTEVVLDESATTGAVAADVVVMVESVVAVEDRVLVWLQPARAKPARIKVNKSEFFIGGLSCRVTDPACFARFTPQSGAASASGCATCIGALGMDPLTKLFVAPRGGCHCGARPAAARRQRATRNRWVGVDTHPIREYGTPPNPGGFFLPSRGVRRLAARTTWPRISCATQPPPAFSRSPRNSKSKSPVERSRSTGEGVVRARTT
jgi:hypothetical protein